MISSMNTLQRSNSAYNWDDWNRNAYSAQYRSGVLWEYLCLARMTIGALLELDIPLESLGNGIDACNGGIICGPSMIAPFIRDDGTLHWSDYGQPQVEQATEIITAGKQGDLGEWMPHQEHMGQCHPAWSEASLRACRLGEAVQQSIFTLSPNTYEIGITCFGPESITEERSEWEDATNTFFDAIQPDHAAVMLYMKYSTGYSSPGSSFPAIPIGEEDAMKVAATRLTRIQTFAVATVSTAIRPAGEPHGYEGMGGIVGLRI
jgi:hypothetical protein